MARRGQGFAARLSEHAFFHFLLEALKVLVGLGLPFAVPAVVAIAAYLEGRQLAEIIALAVFVFAMTAFGLLNFDAWRQRRTPLNKLRMLTYTFGWNDVKDSQGKTIAIKNARVVLNFENRASFPISVIVKELNVAIEGHVATKQTERGVPLILQAEGSGFFRDDLIEMHSLPLQNLEGRMKYVLIYGRPGREKYEITQQVKLNMNYDSQSNRFTWSSVQDSQAMGLTP